MKRKNSKPLVHTETIREVKDIENHNNPPPLFSKEDGYLTPFYTEMLSKFEPEEIQYYAGLVDGDGAIGWNSWHSKTIRMQINLTEEAAEPIKELAEKLDLKLSVSSWTEEYQKERSKNGKPMINLNIYKTKAWFFLFLIYPYLLEKKEKGKEMLTTKFKGFLECHDRRMHQRQFSMPYLAGYSDAEGHFKYKYRHTQKSFLFGYVVHSTAIGHVDYLGEQLCRLGYNVRYGRVLKNGKYKPSKSITISNLPDLKKLYRELLPFSKIKRKKRAMTMTNFYMDYLSPVYSKKERRLC
jgi:hypothetical protein